MPLSLRSKVALGCRRLLGTHVRPNWTDRGAERNVAVVTVNWNTSHLLAGLVFSLCRVLGREQLSRIVVVDNGSTDGSRQLIEALADAGLVDPVWNHRQRYHGPGLNDGVEFLRRRHAQPRDPRDRTGFVWTLDSDAAVLRSDTLTAALAAMQASHAALCGEYQPAEMREGYAHVSSLLFEPARIWRRGFSPFEEHGVPALAMQRSLIRHGVPRLDFPFRRAGYVVHLGHGTLRAVADGGDRSNRYFDWARDHRDPHYGDSRGAWLYEEFAETFRAEAGDLTPQAVVAACLRPGRIRLTRPYA
jgi:hypothetical protein